jgi:hypothetical protein
LTHAPQRIASGGCGAPLQTHSECAPSSIALGCAGTCSTAAKCRIHFRACQRGLSSRARIIALRDADALLFMLRWRAKTTPLCVGLARTRDAASTWGLRGLFAFTMFNIATDRKEILQSFAAAGPHDARRGSARWPQPTTPSTRLPPFTAACSFDVNLFALAMHRPACCAQARAGHLARAADTWLPTALVPPVAHRLHAATLASPTGCSVHSPVRRQGSDLRGNQRRLLALG